MSAILRRDHRIAVNPAAAVKQHAPLGEALPFGADERVDELDRPAPDLKRPAVTAVGDDLAHVGDVDNGGVGLREQPQALIGEPLDGLLPTRA